MAALIECSDESKTLTRSGSGFVLNAAAGLVATSAYWLEDLIAASDSPSGANNSTRLKWRFKPAGPVTFTVTVNAHAQGPAFSPMQCSASLADVCCLPSVHAYLKNVFGATSKDNYGATCNQHDTATPTAPAHRDLVILSSLVILKLSLLSPKCRLEELSFTSYQLQASDTVRLIGTPFGTLCPPVFFNSVSEGCVCKVLEGGDLFVTDARCPRGCEGGVITIGDGFRQVVGVALCPFVAPDGFPAGLSLCCSMATVSNVIQEYAPAIIHPNHPPMKRSIPLSGRLANKLTNMVVGVVNGSSWGTGILLSPGMVLTCSHILSRHPTTRNGTSLVTVMAPSSSPTLQISHSASVIYTSGHHVPDMALLEVGALLGEELSTSAKKPIGQCLLSGACHVTCPEEGRRVFAVGYGLENPAHASVVQPLCARGVVSKVVSHHGNPRLIQTTASVLPGMSGGVVCTEDGEGVGMIVSNSREDDSGWVYPDINYCLPFTWILPPVLSFLSTRDVKLLKEVESCSPEVTALWTLQTSETERNRKSKL